MTNKKLIENKVRRIVKEILAEGLNPNERILNENNIEIQNFKELRDDLQSIFDDTKTLLGDYEDSPIHARIFTIQRYLSSALIEIEKIEKML